jgi:eukaryotic-like serine/threonine-protein kinase
LDCEGRRAVITGRMADMATHKTDDPFVGRTLAGRFAIQERIGAGSMGAVYRALQVPVGRVVAVKILKNERGMDEHSKARFLREARANSMLASAHTVTVFDFGESETGDFYLAMELLNGETLGDRLVARKRLSIREAIDVTRQALRSLGEAHGKGIVHRDLKPDNLFFAQVTTGGRTEEIVKVLDFGIAKMIRDEDRALNAVETQAGTVFGTPRFMSPEQAQGKPIDARSDLYSLGIILYHMLTGNPPYTDDDAVLVMARHIRTPPVPPSQACPGAGIPRELERFVLRVLSKDPDKRPKDAEAMAAELHGIASAIQRTASLPEIALPAAAPLAPNSLDDVSRLLPADESSPQTAQTARRIPPKILVASLAAGLLTAAVIGALLLSPRVDKPAKSLPSTTSTVVQDVPPTADTSTEVAVRPDELPIAPPIKPTQGPSIASGSSAAIKPRTPKASPTQSAGRYGIFN